MNRIDRVTAILIHLQSTRIVKAQEIAERFQISLRTVYRDIRTLEEAGIPILGEAGVGYSLMEGYRLPPVSFTQEEATSFVLAEKIVEKYTDVKNYGNYLSGLYKIKAVLRSGEKDYLDRLDSSFAILGSNYQSNGQPAHSLQEILRAIQEKRSTDMTYHSSYSGESSTRNVEPIGVFLQNSNWHMIAFCNLKNDYRDFRLDRISHIKIKENAFIKERLSLNEYLEHAAKTTDLQTIVINVEKQIAKYIITQKYYYGFISEKVETSHVEMTFLSASDEAFARWFLMIAANAQIVRPQHLKERIKTLLSDIYEKL